MTGWMSITGEPEGPPTKSGLSLVDYSGGYVAGLALLAGLWRARRDGVGCDCDTSLFETALSLLTYVGTWVASRDHEATRIPGSGHPSIVPFQIFPTADGWVAVACAKQRLWQALCDALDRPDLARDERFADFAGRLEHREELVRLLSDELAGSSTDELVQRLSAAGVPCGPVNDVRAALRDPQVAARDGLLRYEHPTLGEVTQLASPLRVDGAPRLAVPGPRRGADTEAVLSELGGLSAEEIERLAAEGAFGEDHADG
ncbi:MAG: CoA transferase [Solirubrobacterales bacterium]|nr:CoA transferase [Solirubrobacterales bacterium]